MSLPAWHEEPIDKMHDRNGFDCGQSDLNIYLQQHARKNHETGASKSYLAIDDGDGRTVHGFYTLSPAQVDFHRVPDIARRKLGRHAVGGFRLGRLAVSRAVQGQGLGGQLLVAAARRCIRASREIGGHGPDDRRERRSNCRLVQAFRRGTVERCAVVAVAALRLAHGRACQGR